MMYITNPTQEYPEGSECPTHKRVHNSHGWYVCVDEFNGNDDPWVGDKCEHGCWEPPVWSGIMDQVKKDISGIEEQLMTISADAAASGAAQEYHTFLTGRIQGLKDVLAHAEDQRMVNAGTAREMRRYR